MLTGCGVHVDVRYDSDDSVARRIVAAQRAERAALSEAQETGEKLQELSQQHADLQTLILRATRALTVLRTAPPDAAGSAAVLAQAK
eukprot:gene5285-3779_t